MGFTRRLVRKSVRAATPRSVRRAMHPVRTAVHAATPRPIRQLSRVAYTVTNPLGAAENALIGAALNGGSRRARRPRAAAGSPTTSSLSAPATRAEQGAADFELLDMFRSVARERFAASARPVISLPVAVDVPGLERELWADRQSEVPFWRWGKRRQLRLEVQTAAQAAAAETDRSAAGEHRTRQERADLWWQQLRAGDSRVLVAALDAAFADNWSPVQVTHLPGADVTLRLQLPGPDVLPERKPVLTPTGRTSSKAWSKTDHADTYAEILGAHLLATVRETFAVGPSVTSVRVTGVRCSEQDREEVLFDVTVARGSVPVNDIRYGEQILAQSPRGLRRTGRTREVSAWPPADLNPQTAPTSPDPSRTEDQGQ